MTIDWENFTLISSLIGGCFIGVSIIMLLALYGKIVGISGIMACFFTRKPYAEKKWCGGFLLGALLVSLIYFQVFTPIEPVIIPYGYIWSIVIGLVIGFGVRMSNGCTSGHGISGISLFSIRSIVATIVFIIFAMMSVYIMRHVIGGLI